MQKRKGQCDSSFKCWQRLWAKLICPLVSDLTEAALCSIVWTRGDGGVLCGTWNHPKQFMLSSQCLATPQAPAPFPGESPLFLLALIPLDRVLISCLLKGLICYLWNCLQAYNVQMCTQICKHTHMGEWGNWEFHMESIAVKCSMWLEKINPYFIICFLFFY